MKKIFFIITMLFIASFGYCQTKHYTWQDCINIANQTNQTLLMAKQDLKIAEYDYNVILNKYYPSVNFKYGFSKKVNDESNENDNWSASLNASQTIYNFGDSSQIRSKKATINKTVAQLTKTSAEVYYSLKESFIRMCYSQEKIILLENIYELRKRSADIVRLQYEGGKESRGNMLKSKAQKQSAFVDVENAKRDLEVAKRTFAQTLGQDLGTDFVVDYKLLGIQDNLTLDIDTEVAKCPDVILSSSTLEITKCSLNISKGNLYPNISASASVGVADETNPFPPADTRSWSLGINLNYPIFSGGITNIFNSIKSAQTELDKAKENYDKTVLTTKTSLETCIAEIAQTRDNIEIYNMFLEASTQRQREATVKYRAGTMEFQIWQDIEQEYVNSQMSHLSALHSYNLALAKIDKVLGNTNGEIK